MTIFIAIVLLLVIFYALSVLTEEFFVPAIDKITDKLKLSSDAAGATLLAAGSSAPEFFTSLVAVLGIAGSGHADVGAGAIVGSAIFNVLVIVGASAMFKSVHLQWKPVMRDMIMYVFTVLLLAFSFMDGKIAPYEAVGFILLYGVYVYMAVNWRKWLKYEDQEVDYDDQPAARNRLHIATHRLIAYVVPDVQKKPRAYVWSFTMSIVLIAAMSWVLVDQILVIADGFNINATFLALTVLAAGTSIPDLIGSIVVARQGRGDMAVSNAVGSNIFDILVGLGLPWVIYGLVHGGQVITVSTDNLLASILLLFATVVAIMFLLVVRNWKIGHKSGLMLVGLYVAYIVYVMVSVA